MKKFIRYFRIYLSFVHLSLIRMLIHRADFLMWTGVHAFELLINIAFFQIIFGRTGGIGGWNIYQVLVLLGFMEITLGLGGCTFYPMMYGFSRMIQRGELDWRLVKPLDTQFLVTFPWIDVSDAASMITGTLLMAYGVSHLPVINLPINIAVFLVSLFLAMLIMYSFIVLLLTLAFKTTKINYLEYVFWNLQWQGHYPATIFKGAIYFVFMFVIPIGLVSTVPAQTLFGSFDWKLLTIMVVYAVGLFSLSRKIFSQSLQSYSSASS